MFMTVKYGRADFRITSAKYFLAEISLYYNLSTRVVILSTFVQRFRLINRLCRPHD